MWTSLRGGKHGAVFEGLRPLVAVREGGKTLPNALGEVREAVEEHLSEKEAECLVSITFPERR